MLKAATKPLEDARTLFGVIPPVMVLTNFILVWEFGTGLIGGAAVVVADGVRTVAKRNVATTAISLFFTFPPLIRWKILPQNFALKTYLFRRVTAVSTRICVLREPFDAFKGDQSLHPVNHFVVTKSSNEIP
ncbi:MAG: hypothetical protein RL228_607 [Actinomycetota bacterium]